MMNTNNKEPISPKVYDWDRSAKDYVSYRPGQPDSYYDFLANYNLGVAGQRIIDLGTGPGLLACAFAQRGGHVTGIDSSKGQIEQARLLAKKLQVDAVFHTCSAEEMPDLAEPVDMVVANMCWDFFDQRRVLDRLATQIIANGSLVISSLRWLDSDPIVERTEILLGEIGIKERIRKPDDVNDILACRIDDLRFKLYAYNRFIEPVRFNLDSWVGRQMTSKRWLSNIPESEDEKCGEYLRSRLLNLGDGEFDIEHQVYIQIYCFTPN